MTWMKTSVLTAISAVSLLASSVSAQVSSNRTEDDERRSFMASVISSRSAEIKARLAEISKSGAKPTILPPPALTPFGDWDFYYLKTAPLIWKPNLGQSYVSVTVPVGFACDLTSIPRVFWSIIRPEGRYAYAAIVHDYLYWIQDRPRQEADDIFRIAMLDSGVDSATVHVIYETVKHLGQAAWDENLRLKKIGEKRVLKRFPADFTISWSVWKKDPDNFSD